MKFAHARIQPSNRNHISDRPRYYTCNIERKFRSWLPICPDIESSGLISFLSALNQNILIAKSKNLEEKTILKAINECMYILNYLGGFERVNFFIFAG